MAAGERIEHVVQIRRSACVVKGGRRFSFGALVVVGDGNGKAGWGYAKAGEVPQAVEKAVREAERRMKKFHLVEAGGGGVSIPYQLEGRCGASRVRLIQAKGGTGLIAGGAVRAVLNAVGVTEILSKLHGSTNSVNEVKAVFDALEASEDVHALVAARNPEPLSKGDA